MRVLFITPTLGVGGSEFLTVSWATRIKERGHTSAVAYGAFDDRLPRLTEAGIRGIRLSDRPLKLGCLGEWRAAVRRAIGSFGPDVVHAQSITTALIVTLAAPRLPLLVTVHGIDESHERLAALILRCGPNRVTAVSAASAAGIGSRRLAPAVEILSPGIDADAIVTAARRPVPAMPAGQPDFCCVARHHPAKGVDVLIRAFPTVLDALPEAKVTLVGSGLDFAANARLVTSLGLEERVFFTGAVPNAAPYIGQADIVVLPSRREGMPIVALEAFSLGRPVIATTVGGTPTVVRDGETGWLVPPESPRALAVAMIEAGRNADEAATRGRAGEALVRRSFTSAEALDRIEGVLRELADGGRTRSANEARRRPPPIKPRPYYMALHAHQRTRTVAAKLRRQSTDWQGVRILGYHRVAFDSDVLAITPDRFRQHVEALVRSGATPVSVDAALDLLERPVHGRHVCMTFDDGFHDVMENAVPILREMGIPATLFVTSGVVSGEVRYHWYGDHPRTLTWEEIAQVAKDPLFDVQAHSQTHPRLPALSEAEAWTEINGSKADIERSLGSTPTTFCYPAGLYGAREVRMVEAAGYRAGISTRAGVNPGAQPMGALRRTMISCGDTQSDFKAKMAGLLDRPSALQVRVHQRRASG